MSCIKDNSIDFDNPQSREEDEELEEERRRQAELADLLAAGIHAFNYDDSTINSSVTSAEGADNNTQNVLKYEDSKTLPENISFKNDIEIENKYKNADQQDQLKVLYDVRVREIINLRNEFDRFKQEKDNEIKVLKNKITLSEAEIRHLQITLTNSESLVVEKSDIISDLKLTNLSKDKRIEELQKLIEEQNVEICTYKSAVNELQLKLTDNNPFNATNKKYMSEELQKIHQDQVDRLETSLQEQSKRVYVLEKEKKQLEEEINKLVKDGKDNVNQDNLTIMALSKKLQSAQQQCKDLYLLGEAIKKESDHFKERIQQFNEQLDISGEHYKKMDKETLIVHLEKLKRMLLDKDVELNTLKTKLKFFEADLTELFEYRRLLNHLYSYEFKPCSNLEHEELIILMQGQLQTFQQAIEDRNNQIMNLNLVNKELQEKIEETIQQTRTDIQNISQKYSLPQLEIMNNELKNAEATIYELKKELAQSTENFAKKNEENQSLQTQIGDFKTRIEEFQQTEKQLLEENERVKTQLQKICLRLGLSEEEIFDGDIQEFSSLQAKYGKIHDQLQLVFSHLENANMKRANYNIIYKLKKQLENCLSLLNSEKLEKREVVEKIEQWDNMLSDFIESLMHSNISKEGGDCTDKMEELMNAKTIIEGEKLELEDQLKVTVAKLEESLKEKESLKKLTQELKVTCEKAKDEFEAKLTKTEAELIAVRKELTEVSADLVKKNLVKELKQAENVLEQVGDDVLKSDVFQKYLQAQVLKTEISLRDELQEEYLKKLQKIEDHYKCVISEKTETYSKEKEKWKKQELVYRKQFAAVLEECGKKMENLEKENAALIKRVNAMVQEYQTFKNNAIESLGKQNKMLTDCKKTMEDLSKQWSKLLESYMIKAMEIENKRRKSAKTVLKKINLHQTEINFIEKLYEEKIKKLESERLKQVEHVEQML